MSSTTGSSPPVGKEIVRGFVPSSFSEPPNGVTEAPVVDTNSATRPSRANRFVQYAPAP